MNEGAPESSSHENFFVLGSLDPLRSDKVSATPELDTSRATEELQEVVLVTQLMAILLLGQQWDDAQHDVRRQCLLGQPSDKAQGGVSDHLFPIHFVGTKIGIPFQETEVAKLIQI